MPMIRVDEEVYQALKAVARTSGSMTNALRWKLGLPKKETRPPKPAKPQEEVLRAIFVVIDRHLPAHWAASREQMKQIMSVVAEFRRTPRDLPTQDRYIRAVKAVAEELGIDQRTVRDKCGRRLYGTGAGLRQTGRFLSELKAIETDVDGSGIFDN